jgi:Na+-transporting NADH:ubiquinone oxidoreductase subunit C
MNREGIIYTVIITFVFSFLLVAVLALTNQFTSERIARNQVLTHRRAVLNAFGIETTGTSEDYYLYESRVQSEMVDDNRFYFTEVGGERADAIVFSGSGLWGPIEGVIAVKSDFSRVLGMDIIFHNETPGLGGRIDESWFKEQFRDEKLKEDGLRIFGTGGGDTDRDNGRIDAVTGATRTSQALEGIINNSLQRLQGRLGVH